MSETKGSKFSIRDVITVAAMFVPWFAVFVPFSDIKESMAVKFFSPVRNVEDTRNSFHEFKPVIIPTVTRPGERRGKMICLITCSVLAPSIRAASSSSFGIAIKNERKREIASGSEVADRMKDTAT